MDYETFKVQVFHKVEERLPGARVGLRSVLKNNSLRQDAVTICSGDENAAPMIYLEQYYDLYLKDDAADLDVIADHIVAVYERCSAGRAIDTSFLEHWETVSPFIVRRLVNTGLNRERLEQAPHLDFLDLSMIYYMVVSDAEDSYGGFMVTDEILEGWDISREELDRAAADNTSRLWPPAFISLPQLLEEMMKKQGKEFPEEAADDEGFLPYVLTNQEKFFGAVWMSDMAVLSRIARQLDSDFYVLPSSVHECLIVTPRDTIFPDDLREMVREVNRTQVLPEEVLSDSVYYFTRRTGQLSIV